MLESALRISFILMLLCGESITFAAEFITRHDPVEITSIYTSIYHPLNYRRAYNLRYEPLDKSREITSSSQINEVVFEAPQPLENTNNSVDRVETTTENVPPLPVSEISIPAADSTSKISSSIMKPQKAPTTKTAQLLGEGLKNLLSYGSTSGATIFRGTHHKGKGFLSLFEVLKFENSNCSVLVGDIRVLHGVCYHEFECKSLGGVVMGACANGVGACCVFITGCGDTTTQPIVYFESPSYPTPVRESLICVLIVNLRPNVRQIHLDFLMFELNRPSNGECIQDQFVVSGQNINFMVPILCGVNTGQHIYIDVDSAIEKKIFLSVFAKGYSPRTFNIKINQLERDLAPEGCLQYYRAPEGIIKSFNYDQFGTIVDTGEVTYLNNLNYVICIERARQMCSILYSNQGNGEQYDFQILNKDDDENDIVPDSQAGAGIFNCPNDYIAINQLRLCGERFNDASEIDDFSLNADVRDTSAGPIILPFRSDNAYVGRGFLLMYKQELCA